MFRNCLAHEGEHAICPQQSKSPLPHRVLSLGATVEDIRLCESRGDVTATAEYAALSHCWGSGDHKPPQLTVENEADLKARIPWNILSPVFQDAIQVCQELDIKYLWIDSLCILQDSKSDWETESARMAQYYEQAAVTLSIECSPDGGVSFLTPRESRWKPRRFAVVDPQAPGVLRCFSVRAHFIRRDLPKSDLLPTRAWAMQESFLSRRLIRFTPSDIIWRCIAKEESELGINWEDCFSDTGHDCRVFRYMEDNTDKNFAKRVWWDIVKAYTERNITKASDRLPGLSGLASRFLQHLNCQYFAGLWEHNLLHDLLWKAQDAHDWSKFDEPVLRPAPAKYMAPSWSWASLDNPVMIDFPLSKPAGHLIDFQYGNARKVKFRGCGGEIRILDVNCTVPGRNPFGEVQRGYLVIQAPLVEVKLTFLVNEGTKIGRCFVSLLSEEPGEDEISLEISNDCSLTEINGCAVRYLRNWGDYDKNKPWDEHANPLQTRAWISWLSCIEYKRKNECELSGLVLGRNSNGTHCRIGKVRALLSSDTAQFRFFTEAQDEVVRIE